MAMDIKVREILTVTGVGTAWWAGSKELACRLAAWRRKLGKRGKREQEAETDEAEDGQKAKAKKSDDAERGLGVGLWAAIALVGLGPVLLVVGALARYAGWALLVASILWSVAALALAPVPAPAAANSPVAGAEEPAPDDGEWIQEGPAPEVLWALIRHTASLTKQGTAAHLQAILDEGRKRGQMTDWTVTDLADELASHGVPVVEQKKLTIGGRQYNRSAVLLADLPEADPAPVPAIVHSAA